jgi:hypothetical protein
MESLVFSFNKVTGVETFMMAVKWQTLWISKRMASIELVPEAGDCLAVFQEL